MQRALRTAELAGFEHPVITPLLKEFDYGRYDGLTSKQILDANPAWDLYRDGCPGGESPAQVYARAEQFIALATKQTEGRAIAFAHGHILRALATAWIQSSITVATNLQLDVAALCILRNGDHGRVVSLWNAQ